MNAPRQCRCGIVPVAMHEERRHRSAMDALVHGGMGFEIELIIHDQMSGEQRMCGDWNSVEQGQDRFAQVADRSSGAGVCDVLDLDRRR